MSASGAPLTAVSAAGGGTRIVTMLDACDPTSFDAVLGSGTCVRNGGVTFQQFINELTARGTAGGWLFAPSNMHVMVGNTLLAVNRGGEAHTFTEVEHFGGGFVQSLNQLSGNPVPAAECLQLDPSDFVPPGGTHS